MGLSRFRKNIDGVCNTKLSTLIPLTVAGIEVLWTILFLVKSTQYLQTSTWI